MKPRILFSKNGLPSPHKIIARKFLEQLTEEMCKGSTAYFKKYGSIDPYHPLTYKERSMYALLAASASKISPVVLSEIPSPRHAKRTSGYAKDGKAGRMDLWVHLKKDYDVLLELKRCYISVRPFRSSDENIKPSKMLKKAWFDVVGQTSSLKKQTSGWSKNTIRIGLLVVYAYTSTKKETSYILSEKQCLDDIKNLGKCFAILDSKPMWSAFWIPPSNMRVLHNDEDTEFNSTIAFLAYVEGSQE